MAGALLLEISQDEKERAKYRSRRMYETDQMSNILTVENRKAKEIARNMKAEGDSPEKIARVTGLSISEIEQA